MLIEVPGEFNGDTLLIPFDAILYVEKQTYEGEVTRVRLFFKTGKIMAFSWGKGGKVLWDTLETQKGF